MDDIENRDMRFAFCQAASPAGTSGSNREHIELLHAPPDQPMEERDVLRLVHGLLLSNRA